MRGLVLLGDYEEKLIETLFHLLRQPSRRKGRKIRRGVTNYGIWISNPALRALGIITRLQILDAKRSWVRLNTTQPQAVHPADYIPCAFCATCTEDGVEMFMWQGIQRIIWQQSGRGIVMKRSPT